MYLTCLLITACGTSPITPSDMHIKQAAPANSNVDIPQVNPRAIPLSPPKPAAKIETYSVVVNDVPAQEILFALARDAKVNLDISSGIKGNVSINAIDQTLPQILDRISKQVDMRYELENGTLSVMPDKPFLKTYKIDFINMSRTTTSKNATTGQIGGNVAGASASGGNTSSTLTTSETKNDLMTSLVDNITKILLEEDRLRFKSQKDISVANKIDAQGDGVASGNTGAAANKGIKSGGGESGPSGGASGAGYESVQASGTAKSTTAEFEKAESVFANKETGVLLVRATARQHEKVQEFIDKVMNTAKRQVLIEATIVEVTLNDRYQQGIEWSRALYGIEGVKISQSNWLDGTHTQGALTIASFGNLLSSITFLETFGNVKVLSSPKMSVMNNQTASLKVADSKVYFTITTTPATLSSTGGILTPATYTSTPVPVSVGFTMSVTPQISDNGMVTINVRPAITRIISYVTDPNPALTLVTNKIPEIQTREMETIIKVESGQTAVMGGLIQETLDKNSREVPLIARIPLLGQLFQNRDDKTEKTELVIFLRPVVVNDASLNGDFKGFANNLPNADFFHEDARGTPTGH